MAIACSPAWRRRVEPWKWLVMRFCCADFDEMDKLIDFSTRGSILSTLRNLTGIAESRITEFVKTLRDFEKGDDPKIDGTILFHGCRCPKNTKFDDGLLPNHLAVDMLWDHIWETCSDLFEKESQDRLRRDFEDSQQASGSGGYFYRLKGQNLRESGPWGKFVRDEWFLEGSNSNHYLNIAPELILVIFNGFSNSVELRERYLERTLPCIVHFLTDLCSPDFLGYGIHFLREMNTPRSKLRGI